MKPLLLIALMAALPAYADHATVKLITNDIPGQSGVTLGTATFELNPNGTIAASLTSIGPIDIFAFRSDTPIEQTGLPAGAVRLDTPGFPYESAWRLNLHNPSAVAWTIGTPGQFTSALEPFNADNGRGVFLLAYDSRYITSYAGYGDVSAIPEPATAILLLCGALAIGLRSGRARD